MSLRAGGRPDKMHCVGSFLFLGSVDGEKKVLDCSVAELCIG
jgi:hypothetical protein